MCDTQPNDQANDAQSRSGSYRLAVEDSQFLLRDEMRAFRVALEFAKAERVLRDRRVRTQESPRQTIQSEIG